jgi:DNA polymerase III epsilon subunit family exonuclease
LGLIVVARSVLCDAFSTDETPVPSHILLADVTMPISLLQPLREVPLAVVDVETTGASADFGHRVIEIGIARYENGREIARYQQLIDPRRPISAGVTALTGITQDMVQGQPRFCEQMPAVVELLQGAVILGHNIRFDLSFLRKEFRGTGRDITDVLGQAHVMDTVRIARRRFGRGGNGLQVLSRRLGIVPEVAHRALADALTTAAVFERLMDPVGGWNLSLCDALLAQGGPMGLLSANPRQSLLPLELEEALEMRTTVMMEYVDAGGQRTHRQIEPIQVRRFKGELLLVAFCHLRQEKRTFKLDRIVQLTRVDGSLVGLQAPALDIERPMASAQSIAHTPPLTPQPRAENSLTPTPASAATYELT